MAYDGIFNSLTASDPEVDPDLTLFYLAAVVESTQVGIVSKDLRGIVRSWNRAAERIFGYTAAEMIGQSILRIVPAEGVWEEDALLARISAGEEVNHFEAERVTRDGRRIMVSLTLSPVRDASGKVIGASKIVRDISQEKRLEQKIEVAKDEFLSKVSHELRTPLTGIRAALRLLEHVGSVNDPTGRASSLLRIANANADRLVRLVDELLDFERLCGGLAPAQLRPCLLSDIVLPAMDAVSPVFAEASIRLELDSDENAETLPLLADPERIQQVLLNLLANALKFSPAGAAVTLGASTDGTHLILRVSDQGRGIPEEKLEVIFERFLQAEGADNRPKGGVGLGLTICRKIVQQHGGTIWAERNDLHKPDAPGTTLVLRLPAFRAECALPAKDEVSLVYPTTLFQ